ncbi:FAD-dependent oxidoreductase [Conyzicola sp.]|uniref:FAD-dependent oxidoreductase n=1 Tax=Conyzicola sp. TaxID=1969404 RepID=UPI0039890636
MIPAPRIVLVGYGPVGARFVEDLLPAVRGGAVTLTVVGAEDETAYNRVLVAEFAVGRTDRSAMEVTDTAAAVEAGVRFVRGTHVTGIDREASVVSLDDESVLGYDRLVLATGARANVPTLDGVDAVTRDLRSLQRLDHSEQGRDQRLPDGVTVLRDLADAATVRAAVEGRKRIVVLGAGVLGLEIALAAAEQGAEVCVVHHGGYPMARNLDRGGGTMLARSVVRAGVALVAHSRAEAVTYRTDDEGTRHFDALVCADGKIIAGDLLVLSCGVSARAELATLAGLPTATGVLVDHGLRSWDDPHVFAIGDCAHVAERPADYLVGARVAGGPTGLIGPGWRQAEWLAAHLSAEFAAAPVPAPLAAPRPALVMLKSEAVDVVTVGDVELEPWDTDPTTVDAAGERVPGRQVSQWVDPEHGRYLKMVTRRGVLEGLVCVGLPRTAAELTLLFERGSELPADRSVLLRNDGPDYAPATDSDAFAPDATVCWCNGVTVAHIHESVAAGDATVACVGKSTRAGTGCGGCKGRIGELIERFLDAEAAELAV